MKRIGIHILMLILIVGIAQATLVDSEDFESYDVALNLTDQSSKWSCAVGTTPPCQYTIGSPSTNGGGVGIGLESGNKYLNIIASDWDDASNYRYPSIYWNNTDSTAKGPLGNANYTITFKYRIITGYDPASLSSFPSRWGSGVFLEGGTMDNIAFGYTSNSTHYYIPSWWTPSVDTIDGGPVSSAKYPTTQSNCSFDTDGQWHSISRIIEYNDTSAKIVNHITYHDGVLCDDSNYALNEAVVGSSIMTMVNFGGKAGVIFNIDDIMLYEDEFVVAPAPGGAGNATGNCTPGNCTTWGSSYYLKEDFNNYLGSCDWSTLENLCFDGSLSRTVTDDLYWAFKQHDEFDSSDTRYYTTRTYLEIGTIDSDGYISISLIDEDFQTAVQFLIGENGTLYNNNDGNVEIIGDINASENYTIDLHVDLSFDTWKLYVDGSVVASGLEYKDNFLDFDVPYGVKITSREAEYSIYNLSVYGSDSNNVPFLPDDFIVVIPNSSKSMCGLFIGGSIPCNDDDDCETGLCNTDGRCSAFNWKKACDDEGKNRDESCYYDAIFQCRMDGIWSWITDNFIYFLLLILFLMILAFFAYINSKT